MGDFQDARSFCEKKAEVQVQDDTQHCLAMTYDKLGRRADAEAMLAKLRLTPANQERFRTLRFMRNGAILAKALNLARNRASTARSWPLLD